MARASRNNSVEKGALLEDEFERFQGDERHVTANSIRNRDTEVVWWVVRRLIFQLVKLYMQDKQTIEYQVLEPEHDVHV